MLQDEIEQIQSKFDQVIALTPRKSPEVRLLSTELHNHLSRLVIRVSDLQLSVEAELKKWRQLFKRE